MKALDEYGSVLAGLGVPEESVAVYAGTFKELGIPPDMLSHYANEFRGKTVVAKAGGEVVTRQYTTAFDLVCMDDLGVRTVLVHGGKNRISQRLTNANVRSEFVQGYRVTPTRVMKAVERALDEVGIEFCDEILKSDGEFTYMKWLIGARRHGPIDGRDLGLVGEPVCLYKGKIENVRGVIVASPVAYCIDADEALNVNADTAASFIAREIGAEKLIFLTNVKGVMLDGQLIHKIGKNDAERYIDTGHINGGMVPKIRHAVGAGQDGVHAVHIINGTTKHALLREIFSDKGIGTMIA